MRAARLLYVGGFVADAADLAARRAGNMFLSKPEMQWLHDASSSFDVSPDKVDFSEFKGMEGHLQDEEDDEDANTASSEVITADAERGAIQLCEGMCAASSAVKSSKSCTQRCEAGMFDCLEKGRSVPDNLLRFQVCEHVTLHRVQVAGGSAKGPIVDSDCDAVCQAGDNSTCAAGCKEQLRKCSAGSSSEACRHVTLSEYVTSVAHKPEYEMKAELNFVHRLPRPAQSPMSHAMSTLNAMDTASELGSLGKLCSGVCGDSKQPQCLVTCNAGMSKCMDHADERSMQGAEEHDKCTKDVVRAHIS